MGGWGWRWVMAEVGMRGAADGVDRSCRGGEVKMRLKLG